MHYIITKNEKLYKVVKVHNIKFKLVFIR